MISILIPIYNGIEFINESVPSIINQTFSNWELIIGVNGHPENSEVYNIAKSYEGIDKRIKVYDLFEIKGKSNALNKMLEFCSYDWIALLDVDDIWHHQKLEVQVKFLNNYDVIGSNCIWFGDRPGIVPKIPQQDFSDFDFSKVNPIINSSSLIKKELCYWYHDLNGIANEMNGVEDYDMWIRLRKQNKKFYNCPQILVKHRIHNQSAFNAKGNNNKVITLLMHHNLI